MREVPYVNLIAQYQEEREQIHACVDNVFLSGLFVGGRAIQELELELATILSSRNVVALNSGTDALILGLKALKIGPGDEVITPPNSFVSSTAAIIAVGARPVFVDVLPDQNIDPMAIERVISHRTCAIMPVHLTGRMANIQIINDIADQYGLYVIEDSAQAIGSKRDSYYPGVGRNIACFSAHPLKNLNAAGDAGFVAVNDDQIAERIRRMANNGLADRNTVWEWGTVSRLDTLQAEILKIRLKRLPEVIKRRRANAQLYRQFLPNDLIYVPPELETEFNTYHTFVIQVDQRDDLRRYLSDHGIETAIHYPVPIHLQPAAKDLGYRAGDFPIAEEQSGRILTLPIHQFLDVSDIEYVAGKVKEYFSLSRLDKKINRNRAA